jgi:hypothetical protein
LQVSFSARLTYFRININQVVQSIYPQCQEAEWMKRTPYIVAGRRGYVNGKIAE